MLQLLVLSFIKTSGCIDLHTYVTVIILQVDQELFSILSEKKLAEATKFSLVCSNEIMFKQSIENLVLVSCL